MSVKIDLRMPLEHGVMFLTDPYSQPKIPPDTGAAPVTATPSCIAFWVAHYVDGEAEVTLTDLRPPVGAKADFIGEISTESGIVSVSDSNTLQWAMLPISGTAAQVSLWRNVLGERDRIWITFANTKVF